MPELYSEYLASLLNINHLTGELFLHELRTELMHVLVCGLDRDKDDYTEDYGFAFKECAAKSLDTPLTDSVVMGIANRYRVAKFLLMIDCKRNDLIPYSKD